MACLGVSGNSRWLGSGEGGGGFKRSPISRLRDLGSSGPRHPPGSAVTQREGRGWPVRPTVRGRTGGGLSGPEEAR